MSAKPLEKSFSQKGIFPAKYAFTLLLPLRNIFLSPRKLIQRLKLQENHTVLEVGPGPGYFSVQVAKTLKTGKLVLLDIQKEMLAIAKKRLARRNLENIEYVLTDGESLALESNSFDRIFLVTVLGEVENRDAYFREFHRILKPDGILSISELAGDPDKLRIDDVQAIASAHGFALEQIFGKERNFTINFKKKLA